MSSSSSSRRPRRGRALRAALTGVVAAASAALLFAAPAAAAATGTVHTNSGVGVRVHSGPHISSTVVGSVADGASITIDCQTYGDEVTGKYGTSTIWDHTPAGYLTDTYVYTGSDGMVAPLCGGGSGEECSTSGLGDPNTCAQAVSWARSHETTSYHSEYDNLCDHVAGLEYGFPASGSTSAYVHWTQIPSGYKHPGDHSVPAGGLAFFGGGYGHVMISIGGGTFVSNDIHGAGTLTETTIAEIHDTWGKPYLGWAQPWFHYNH